MTLLRLNHLVYGYRDGFRSLPLSAEIPENLTVGFFGPNGSGKTTLLKTILGIMPALSGNFSWAQSLRHSYLPQASDTSPILPITVKEVLRAAHNHHIDEAVDALGDPFGIRALLPHSFHRLSGGQKQRVLMTRAFLAKPEVLFLDEPNNHVDQGTRALFWDVLNRMKSALGIKGVFIIDHDAETLRKHADRIFDLGETT